LFLDGAAPAEAAVADLPGLIVGPALEQEAAGEHTNDEMATAEELAFSYLVPAVSVLSGCGPQQAAVSGTADGSGGGSGYDVTSYRFGPISPLSGFDAPFLGTPAPGGDAVLTVTLSADLGGAEKYLTVMGEDGTALGDMFVTDGLSGTEVTGQLTISYQQIASMAADGEITLTVVPSSQVTATSGPILVILQLAYPGGGAGTGDFYRFDLAGGESASLSLAGSGQVGMELYDAAGNLLASAATAADGSAAGIENFVPSSAGTYYVRVGGSGQYTLMVNRNAMQDVQDQADPALAQEITGAKASGRQWVIGDVSSSAPDYYALNLTSKGTLKVDAYTPASAGELTLSLYDADGSLVASSSGKSLHYKVPKGGDGLYYLQVSSGDAANVDYVLGVMA